jgi:DNA-binding MarR family transcriptional regulator
MPENAKVPLDEESTPRREGVGTIYLLVLAQYASRMRVEQVLKPYGVTGLQYSILAVVDRHAGLSSAQLSRRFYATPQNMGQLLASLEARGLIQRQEDTDNRRVLRISLTEEGRRLVREGGQAMERLEAEIYQDFSAEELAAFRASLRRLTRPVGSAGSSGKRA